jgi:hypothetical protein
VVQTCCMTESFPCTLSTIAIHVDSPMCLSFVLTALPGALNRQRPRLIATTYLFICHPVNPPRGPDGSLLKNFAGAGRERKGKAPCRCRYHGFSPSSVRPP